MFSRYRQPVALVSIVLVASALALGGCGDDSAKTSPMGARERLERAARRAAVVSGPDASVIASDNRFVLEGMKVRVGTPITFTNKGRNLHNVIPLDGGGFRIDTDELRPATSRTVRISRPGTYRYFCSIHGTATRGMIGAIAVVR